MTTTTIYPATVKEAGDMAEERGITFVELLDELGSFPEVPAGYTEAEGVDGLYLGGAIEAAGVVMIPTWDYRTQTHEVELWTGKGTNDEAMVRLSPADALQVSTSLTAAARVAA